MDYDFEAFKTRNKELNKKINREQSVLNEEENSKMKNKTEMDSKTLEKLQSLIEEDKDNMTDDFAEEFKKINVVVSKPSEEEENKKESEVLVHRPSKNFVWGLGHQVKKKKRMEINFNLSQIYLWPVPDN